MLGLAKTGSGKTAAYVLPMLVRRCFLCAGVSFAYVCMAKACLGSSKMVVYVLPMLVLMSCSSCLCYCVCSCTSCLCVLGLAKTGSGKTAAYVLPMLVGVCSCVGAWLACVLPVLVRKCCLCWCEGAPCAA